MPNIKLLNQGVECKMVEMMKPLGLFQKKEFCQLHIFLRQQMNRPNIFEILCIFLSLLSDIVIPYKIEKKFSFKI